MADRDRLVEIVRKLAALECYGGECICDLRDEARAGLAAIESDLCGSTESNSGSEAPTSREWLLDDALQGAISTIEFLHGCLTEPNFRYAYPEQTLDRLNRLRALVSERPPPCAHSKLQPEDCESCRHHVERLKRRAREERLTKEEARVNPFLAKEALASVALSHEDDCGCDVCKAAAGDEAAFARCLLAIQEGESE